MASSALFPLPPAPFNRAPRARAPLCWCSAPSESPASALPPPKKSAAASRGGRSQLPLQPPHGLVPAPEGFEVVEDVPLFERFRAVFRRDVRYPSGEVHSFDVLGDPKSAFRSVFVFPLQTDGSVVMTEEYTPGTHAMTRGFVAGMFDPTKHDDLEHAARAELEEETGFQCERLIKLVDSEESSMPQDKYSLNMFSFYLAEGCSPILDKPIAKCDDEEFIRVITDVSLSDAESFILRGQVNTAHTALGLLAFNFLRRSGSIK